MRTEPTKANSIWTLGLRWSGLDGLVTLSLLLTSLLIGPAARAAALPAVMDQGCLNLSWDAPDATLEEAPALNGPWQTVITTNSSYRLRPSTNLASRCQLFRLNQPPPGKKWLTVAAVTTTSDANTATNLQTFYSAMEQAASNGVDLIVFPELALQGCPPWADYDRVPTPAEMAYVRGTAETVPGPSTSNLVARANALNLFVVFGMTEQDTATTNLYSSAVFLGPQGVLGTHRKSMSFGNDARLFARGTNLIEVFDSPIGRAGINICGEIAGESQSEATLTGPRLAAAGADFLLTVTGWWASDAALYDPATTLNASRANRWHVVADQVGLIGYVWTYGHSRVVDPQGRILCDTGSSEGLVTWETDILIDANPFEDRPFITTQPTTQWVPLASNATFSVSAYSPAPMTYQWQWNGTNIVDATNATLTLTNVQLANEGVYTVVVTDTNASVPSAPANLHVLITPVILQPPLSQTVVEGGSVTLSAVISGNPPPFLFHWRRGMFTVLTNIVQNQRTCFFTLANVQINQGGQYRLYITNAASPNWTAISTTFNLTVLADTDTDGLPDLWETQYGLDPANAEDAVIDGDADGLTNGQEYTAGTDPTNALSYLKVDTITLAEGSSTTMLRFFAVSNKTYTVQYRNSLDDGGWNRLVDVVALSSNRLVEISDPGMVTAAQRFYRLVTPRVP
jgi:predicted amidohydrolase